MYDIIVVGGGPAGSYTAGKLAEKGYRVAVLEARRKAGEKLSCTGIVGWEFVQKYNIPQEVILRMANSAMVYSPGGNTLHLKREEPQACILDRQAFDIHLAESARQTGVEYRFGCHVKNIITLKDRAEVQFSCQDSNEQTSAKAVVLASGFNPGLNELAGLGSFKDYTAGAQAEVAAPGLEEVQVYFGGMAPGFFAWLVPTVPGMARAGLLARQGAGTLLKTWLTRLEKQGKIKAGTTKISYGGLPLKPPARTYSDRLLAVGDAAGHTKPTSGGGLYYGLIGADIAIDVLHQAFQKDDLTAAQLEKYQRGWKRRLGKEIRTGYWARRLFEKLSDAQIDAIFTVMKSAGIDEALLKAKDLSFDWHSRTIFSLLKYQAFTKTLNIIKTPFKASRIDRKSRK